MLARVTDCSIELSYSARVKGTVGRGGKKGEAADTKDESQVAFHFRVGFSIRQVDLDSPYLSTDLSSQAGFSVYRSLRCPKEERNLHRSLFCTSHLNGIDYGSSPRLGSPHFDYQVAQSIVDFIVSQTGGAHTYSIRIASPMLLSRTDQQLCGTRTHVSRHLLDVNPKCEPPAIVRVAQLR